MRKLKRKKKARPEAVVIKPREGQMYADVLRLVKTKVSPEEHNVTIEGVRQTRSGCLLVEITANDEGKCSFKDKIADAVKEVANVRHLSPMATLEIRDLDAATEADEVRSAIMTALGDETANDFKVNLSKSNSWGSKVAYVLINEARAVKLDQMARIKIGWIRCRIRIKENLTRCYKCGGFDHIASKCTGSDRSNHCWRCGAKEHQAKDCKNPPNCYLCAELGNGVETNHVPGAKVCKAYENARNGKK